jgi:thioredoxin-related protein
MKKILGAFLFLQLRIFADFQEIQSAQELQKKLLSSKECIVAIGLWPCIPCDKVKKRLIQDQDKLPDIYWIDVKKHPKIRHIFNFKAVPYLAVYKNGEAITQLTGETSCQDHLSSIQYLEHK